jgi:hypothetical protein
VTALTFAFVTFLCTFGCALLGMAIRSALPPPHLSKESQDVIRLGMGLVATMAALVLGLLVASAKGSYDSQKAMVVQMAGKIAFLDRVLAHYGPESAESRALLRQILESAITHIWAPHQVQPIAVTPSTAPGAGFYDAIQQLAPQNESQRALKAQAVAMSFDLGQMRWLLFEQAGSSISLPLVVIVVFWLAILFFSFGLFGPANTTAVAALMVAAFSVSGSLFLIMELDQPFGGLIQISRQPMVNALDLLGR